MTSREKPTNKELLEMLERMQDRSVIAEILYRMNKRQDFLLPEEEDFKRESWVHKGPIC